MQTYQKGQKVLYWIEYNSFSLWVSLNSAFSKWVANLVAVDGITQYLPKNHVFDHLCDTWLSLYFILSAFFYIFSFLFWSVRLTFSTAIEKYFLRSDIPLQTSSPVLLIQWPIHKFSGLVWLLVDDSTYLSSFLSYAESIIFHNSSTVSFVELQPSETFSLGFNNTSNNSS